jgi:hypothetical protein
MQEEYVTTAHAPQARAGALARGWRNFRRWRRGRPFWGGLLLLLSGVEVLASGNLDLTDIHLHIGPVGFLSYLIPGMIALCGLLSWISPAQRLFYGIVGALVAVYSLIGVNLGGFFIGMLLGITGGALTAAWTPVRLAPPPVPPDDEEPQPGEGGYADEDAPADEPAAGERYPREPAETTMDGLLSGPLTDVLPSSTRSPLADDPQYADQPRRTPQRGGWGAPEPPPPGQPPRRSHRLIAITLVPLTLAAVTVSTVRQPMAALAEPCPPAGRTTTHASSAPAGTRPTTATTRAAPATSSAAPPAPSASASPAAGTTQQTALLGQIIDFWGGLFTAFRREPTPSASSSPQPAPAPASGSPAPAPPSPTRSATKSTCTSGGARALAVEPGQPKVNVAPSIMTSASLIMSGLTFDGVVELPTFNGTIRVLQFSMSKSVATPFSLQIPAGGPTLGLTSTQLTVEGNVKFYTNRFRGNLFGLIPVEFTPDQPPLLILPELQFSNAVIQLVFVRTDALTAPNLDLAFQS